MREKNNLLKKNGKFLLEDGGYNCFPNAKVKVHYKVKHLLPWTRTDESYPMLISYIHLKHLQYFSQQNLLI